MSRKILRYSTIAVLLHAAVTAPHAAAHAGADARLSPAGNAFVALVIVLAPFVALALMRFGRPREGALLLFAAMLGALLFGIINHFVLPGPDNVAAVAEAWRSTFWFTSALLVVTEAAGVAVGVWALYFVSIHHRRLP